MNIEDNKNGNKRNFFFNKRPSEHCFTLFSGVLEYEFKFFGATFFKTLLVQNTY